MRFVHLDACNFAARVNPREQTLAESTNALLMQLQSLIERGKITEFDLSDSGLADDMEAARAAILRDQEL